MRFDFTTEQAELKKSARRFLAQQMAPAAVRAAMQTEDGWDRATWRRIAGELGWAGIGIDEQHGGAGLGAVEITALMEELGRALACSPFFSSVCLGAGALLASGDEGAKRRFLPAVASGEKTLALAVAEGAGGVEPDGVQALAGTSGDGFVLSGEKSFVVDGHSADLLLVAARASGTRGPEGISLFAVEAEAGGITKRRLEAMDMTRRLATVKLEGARGVLVGEEGKAWPWIERTLDRARVALAAEQLGGAERCLEMAIDHAKTRVQFSRPVGSFQAVKHKLADMLVLVESARSAAYWAAWVVATGGDELGVAASLARVYCSDAFVRCAGESIQIHGGIGFTWEHEAHLFFKRAHASAVLLGSASAHRERIARHAGM
jgi:alkylation response protein AidB-like acyl-CoA dehydrogenase